MKKRQSGFTLIEVLISIAVLGIIMAMNSTILQEMMRGTRQQGAVAATQFETTLGLEVLRADLASAGYGLIDTVQSVIAYNEAVGTPAQLFNDAPSGTPRAIVHNNDVSAYATYLANSDYLVIKSPAVGMNDSAGKWTYITGTSVHVWNDVSLDMADDGQQRMIVVVPSTKPDKTARLVVDGANNYEVVYKRSALDAAFQPIAGERYTVYGVDNSDIVRPFNRADYYVRHSNATGANCAPNTGTFIKSVIHQAASGGHDEQPLIDCVAGMQVLFRVDTDGNGVAELVPVNDISGYTARQIKENIKEIRVYILAHEGAMDRGFRYNSSSIITLSDPDYPALGAQIDLQTLVGANWDRYRWKIYTVTVSPRGFYG
jgi:prepilin-type N-terminal cleavage/methylation domain-containing protein